MNTTTEPSEAVLVPESKPMPVAAPVEPHNVTPAQAKVEAIANLTFKAYERASTLQITPEEAAALAAEFPDEAFKQGAGGNPDLIYIEHAFLRDRLSQVFGPGQWAIIPRNRWAEDFRTKNGDEASRVYVEAMLVIRGCFVSEAVGDMVYYKNNATQNYGDAVEGAKTACLRRCAKELGIGLQAWKKDFCEAWKQRRRAPAHKPAPATPPPAKPASVDPAKLRERMIVVIEEHKLTDAAKAFAEQSGWIMPNETLADVPDNRVPRTMQAMDDLLAAINRFVDSGEVPSAPDPADQVPGAEVATVPNEWFMGVIVPVPRKGQKRDDYLKHPDTIGSLYQARHGDDEEAQAARQRLWGFVNHFEAKPWVKKDGTKMPPSTVDLHFRDALDSFQEWFEKNHPDEKL